VGESFFFSFFFSHEIKKQNNKENYRNQNYYPNSKQQPKQVFSTVFGKILEMEEVRGKAVSRAGVAVPMRCCEYIQWHSCVS
jgi:hypothetical protein